MEEARKENEECERQVKIRVDKIEKLKAEFNDASEDNFTVEIKQHRIKYKKETTLESVVQKYDKDLTEMHSKFVELEAVHNDELDELEKIRAYYQKVEAEEKAIEEERESLRRTRNAEINRKRIQKNASVLLQKMFLAFYLKNIKAGGKGGKGKGKKK